MKKVISVILTVCMLMSCAVFFSGCSTENSKDWPVTVGEVTINSEPKNVVVLDDEFADIISYIGYDIKLVGRSVECDQDFLYIVPTVGSAAAPDVEAIKSAEADLVIADKTLSDTYKQQLEAAGITVLTLSNSSNEDELLALYTDLGKALGGKETGAKKGEEGYNDLFDMLSTLNTASSAVVQTAVYLYLDDSGKLCTFTKGSLEYKLFSYNGCTNVLLNQTTPEINTEELKIDTPTYIFYDSEEVLSALAADPNTTYLPALTNGKHMLISKLDFERHGYSAEDAVYQMLAFIELSDATMDEAAPETAAEAATEAEADTSAEAENSEIVYDTADTGVTAE